MRQTKLLPVILALGLTGCLPQPATPANVDDVVATTVSATLAAQPSPVAPASPLPQVTLESPAPTTPPSSTPEPTLIPPSVTPSITASPTNTTTPMTGDPRAALGQPTWRDPFDDGSGWDLGEDSFAEAKVEGGKFVLTGRTTADGWRLTGPEIGSAYLESSIETGTCTGSDEYGLMFRVPDFHAANEGYLFGFTCDGRYFLRTWDGENMETLISATSDSAIQAGSDKTNRIGVWAEGDELGLYANGTLLDEFSDSTYSDGGFGFFIGARQTEEFTVEADEIAYWDID